MSEYEPITGELREMMGGVEPRVDDDGVVTAHYVTPEAWGEFVRRCDAIDAVHAGLERENAELRERVAVLDNERGNLHDGMSITDELRAWWIRKFPVIDKELHKDFTAIADRIDVEHQKALDEWKAKHGQMWLKGYAECHAELLEGNKTLASDLESCGWIRLPLDADGVPWHINDEFEIDEGIAHVNGVGDNRLFYIDNDGIQWTRADNKLHHHAPTVEDVLREFTHAILNQKADYREQNIAEYAAKLRLAGDAS